MIKFYPRYIVLFVFLLIANGESYAQRIKDAGSVDYELARQYISEGNYSSGIALLEDLIDKNFSDRYYSLLKSAYVQINDTKKHEKLIKKAIKSSADDVKYEVDLAVFYLNGNEKKKADRISEKIINNLSANNSQITLAASCFIKERLYDYAIKTYNKGRALFKDDTRYTYELTYVYRMLDQNDKIAEEYLLLLEKNPRMLHQIEVNINNLFAMNKDEQLYGIFSDAVLEKVKANPQNKEMNQLYYWLQLQKGDYASAFVQAKALDKRFNNGNSYMVKEFALAAQNANNFDYAVRAYDYLLKNATDEWSLNEVRQNRLTCLYKQYTQKTHHTSKEANAMKKEYDDVFQRLGYKKETVATMQQYADLLAYHLQQSQQAVDLLDSIINMNQVSNLVKAQSKLTRADIHLMNGDIWEASLTYSQVDKDFKHETIGTEAKFRNAKLSYFIGDFVWAESQFDALRSSTTKLIANDAMEYSLLIRENLDEDSAYQGLTWFAKADFLLYQNRPDSAVKYLDSIDHWFVQHPLFDEVLYKRAQIALAEDNYVGADSLLQVIIEKYPYDLTADDALMLLAQINERHFNDSVKAKEYYERIILDYPSSLYVQQARKKYKQL